MKILPIHRKHIKGFRQALDQVSREGKYLLFLKAPPLKEVRRFVLSNIKKKVTQFVALDGEKVVGWCDILPYELPTVKHTGVLGIGLLPGYREKGIGAQLLKRCLQHAKRRGLEMVYLGVYSTNKRAGDFYRKLGFTVDGTRKRARKHKGNYEDMVLMSKRLK